MTTAEILLKISSDVEGVRKVSDALAASREEARRAAQEIKNARTEWTAFGSDFAKTVASGLGIGAGFTAGAAAARVMISGVRDVTGALKDTITEGVRFNATLEQSALGVASVLKQFNPEKYRTFSEALSASSIVIDQLKKKALETAATFEELLVAFQGSAGAMAAAGIPLNKQVELIVNISQAMAALGIRTEEMRQEATALLMGNIDRNARLAQTLGITGDQIRAMKERGQLYQFLTEKLKSFSEASDIAQGNIVVLESNLQDAKTQIAAANTQDLANAYRELLGAITDLVRSDAYASVLRFLSSVSKDAVEAVGGWASLFTDLGAAPQVRAGTSAARDTLINARSEADVRAARSQAAIQLRAMRSAEQQESAQGIAPGVLVEAERAKLKSDLNAVLMAARDYGSYIVAANKAKDEQAARDAAIDQAAKAADRARAEGVKKYADETEKAQARIRAAAKATDPVLYLSLLQTDQAALKAKLGAPKATAAHYLAGNDAQNADKARDAQKAADAYRLEITGKLATVEKEITLTTEAQAKKTQAEQDRREKAELRFLQVKSQSGTLDERIAALTAEKNALDQTDLNYRADALSIELRIARLKDDEVARMRTEASEARQRAQQAEINRIKDSEFLTERQKREQLYTAFKREQREIAEKIRIAEALVKSQPEGSATKAQAQSDLRTLRTRQDVGLPQDIAQNKPLGQIGEIGAAMTQLENGFRTVASSISDIMGSAIGGISEGIQGLINRTMTWGQAGLAVASSIAQSTVKAFADMAAQSIVQYGVMDNVRRVFHIQGIAEQTTATTTEAGIHAAGETAKTGATAGGSLARGAIRLAETVFHGLQVAWRVATHVAGEIAKTVATGAQTALRLGMIVVESIGSVIKAGAGAMSAVASIPYVGPILAVAALAAVIAAGMAAVKGIGKGFATGGYTERGDRNEVAGAVHKGEWVAPKWMVEDPKFGSVIAGLEAERRGEQGYSWGGFVRLLGRGMPRWLQDPITRNVVDKWNPVTGTKLYGNPQVAGSSTVMDTRTDAQRAALDDFYVASGSSAVGGSAMLASAGDGGGIGNASARPSTDSPAVNMAFFNTRQDVETWLSSQRGRRVMVDFLRQNQTEL